MPRILLSVLLLLSSVKVFCQYPTLQWAKTFDPSSANNSNGRSVGLDAAGNVYTAGLFEETVDFNPGPGVFNLTGGGGSGSNTGIYISKLDANGNFVWAIQIPTYVEFGQIEIKVDPAGNVYLVSELNNPADMDPGPGVYMMSPTGFRDAFVAKYNSNGQLVWAKQFGGPGDTGPQGYAIALDKDLNVIVGGAFNNTVDFDPGPGTLNMTSSAHFQAFLVKLNNDGELIWARQFGNGPDVYSGCTISDIRCDALGNIITIGFFARTVDFDPGPAQHIVDVSPGSAGDGFICKLDGNANFFWVKTLREKNGNNNYFSHPVGVDIDGMGNFLLTGYFIGNVDFDPGPGESSFFRNPHDCFILKLNGEGDFVWVKIIGDTEIDIGNDVVVDAANDVYVVGTFGPSVDYDPGPGTYTINSTFYGPSVLIKLTAGGDFVYAAPFHNDRYSTSHFRRMAIDPSRNIYITGVLGGTVDFDPGPGEFKLYGGSAPFVLKLAPCADSTTATLHVSDCRSYTINNQTFDSTGTYFVRMLNSVGCDSLITLHLIINQKMTEQARAICAGESFFAGGGYQTSSGMYYDTLQTSLGCDSIIKTSLTVNPVPAPDLGPDRNICANEDLSISPGPGFTQYRWQDNSRTERFDVSTAGLYWVEVTNSFNCAASDSLRILSLIDPPAHFLPETDSICSYKALDLSPSQSFSNYQWSTGASTYTIQVQTPGTYWLAVTDADGCKGADTINILYKQCMYGVYIPTAFTPDQNGRNDVFRALVFGHLSQFRLQVFNRWGRLVFQTENPGQGWDGTIGGKPADTGLYVWMCSYHLDGTEPQKEKGTLTLLR